MARSTISGTDSVTPIDLCIDRTFNLEGADINVSLDAFNLFNEGASLQRERDLTSPRVGLVDEFVSPRAFRFDVGFRFWEIMSG